MFGVTDRLAAKADRLATALARASASVARLDQALIGHPLRSAFHYRMKLDAIRRQAGVDGHRIDPWHLAALIEGLRLRMDPFLSIAERGEIFEGGRHAFDLYQWLTLPEVGQEGEIQRAERALAASSSRSPTPLLAAASGLHAWLDAGEDRAPIRAALSRFWARQKLLILPLPLTGDSALGAGIAWRMEDWVPVFLSSIATEAEAGLQLLMDMERAWLRARVSVSGKRRNSRAAVAVDILAASPIVSASSLATGLGMAVKSAGQLLDELCQSGIVIEVTHRSKRRLFGLSSLAPIREVIAPPKHPEPGRGRGRPRILREEEPIPAPPPLPPAPITPLERRSFDYSDLDRWMAEADEAIRKARRNLSFSKR